MTTAPTFKLSDWTDPQATFPTDVVAIEPADSTDEKESA